MIKFKPQIIDGITIDALTSAVVMFLSFVVISAIVAYWLCVGFTDVLVWMILVEVCLSATFGGIVGKETV